MSVIDLIDLSSEFQPALTAIAADYKGDHNPEYIVSNDLDDEGDVTLVVWGILFSTHWIPLSVKLQ